MIDSTAKGSMETTRRQVLIGLSSVIAFCGDDHLRAWADEKLLPPIDHLEAVDEGRRRGIGRIEVASTPSGPAIVAGDFTTFTMQYAAGESGIAAGGYIWFALRHICHSTPPQTVDASRAGFVRVEGPAGVALDVVLWQDREDQWDLFVRSFPWQNVIEVRVRDGVLKPSDKVTLIYGDRSGGGPGVRVQPTQQSDFGFRIFVATASDERVLPLADDVVFPVVGGPVERLSLVAPSSAAPDEPIRLLLRAEDKFGNEAVSYDGAVVVHDGEGRELRRLSLTPEQRGLAWVEIDPSRVVSVRRFDASDGTRAAKSNPVDVGRSSKRKIYFGDIHGHTVESDGIGTPDAFYRYAREVARLDFCAITDHDFMLTDGMWADIQAATERANEPGKFATIHAYEWSGTTDVGGDHNVYFRGTDTVLLRCDSYYDSRNQQAYHGRNPRARHVKDLYSVLERLPEGSVMTIPHFGGRQANPAWHNPRIERMIEIFSDHQRSWEWASEFLRRGYRLGLLASSDNHTGRPGYGFLHNPLLAKRPVEIGTALVAVHCAELSREAVFDSIFARRAYATSGDRILLYMRLGDAEMGEDLDALEPPELQVEVEGTDVINAIEIWKDGKVASAHPTGAVTADLRWADPAPPEVGQTSSYWVRIVQANGEEAISSPIWWRRSSRRTANQ